MYCAWMLVAGTERERTRTRTDAHRGELSRGRRGERGMVGGVEDGWWCRDAGDGGEGGGKGEVGVWGV